MEPLEILAQNEAICRQDYEPRDQFIVQEARRLGSRKCIRGNEKKERLALKYLCERS